MAKKQLVSDELIFDQSKEDPRALLKVSRQIWRSENGSEESRYKYHLPDAVVIVAFDESGRLIVIDEFQPLKAVSSLKFAGGMIDDEEAPTDTAKRELLEETGFSAGSLKLLARIAENTGFSDRTMWYFLATDCRQQQNPEEGVTVKTINPKEFWYDLMNYFDQDVEKAHGRAGTLKGLTLALYSLGRLLAR